MKPRYLIVPMLIAFSVFLAACSVNFVATVKPDGSGEFGMEFILTAQDKETLAGMGASMDDLCEGLGSQSGAGLPLEMAFRQEEHGGDTWCIASLPFKTLDELHDNIESSQESSFRVNRLEIQGDQFFFDVDVDMGGSDMSDLGFSIDMNLSWKLTVPGTVGAHNANRVEGRTLIWDLDIGQNVNMRAESSTSTINIGLLLIFILLALLIVGTLIALLVVLVKKPAPQANLNP